MSLNVAVAMISRQQAVSSLALRHYLWVAVAGDVTPGRRRGVGWGRLKPGEQGTEAWRAEEDNYKVGEAGIKKKSKRERFRMGIFCNFLYVM